MNGRILNYPYSTYPSLFPQGIATMNLGRYLFALSTLAILYWLDPHGACIAQQTPINAEKSPSAAGTNQPHNDTLRSTPTMNLGAFSISLTVKDIRASKAFYEKLGFKARHGNIDENWLVMTNGDHVIGLFQGMFEKNMLTFNPVGIRTHSRSRASPMCASCSGG
jgi:hypothetical protein